MAEATETVPVHCESKEVDSLYDEDTSQSPISDSLGNNSVKQKDMFASIKLTEVDNATIDSNANMWWVRKSVETTELLNGNVNGRTSPIRPLDAISSMTEFLARERLCKRNEDEVNDDTFCDILDSGALDGFQLDLDNTDDIGTMLEEMSKIADKLSPNVPEKLQSERSSKNPTEEEEEMEGLLKEAKELAMKSLVDLTLEPETTATREFSRVTQLENDIFKQIEEEVIKESEKMRKSPKIDVKTPRLGDSPLFPTEISIKERVFVAPKKVTDSKDELYNIDLTPRLGLFADELPKLAAEKTKSSSLHNLQEMAEMKQQNLDNARKNEDLQQQNSLLSEELEMYKEQLKMKNNFINERLQEMTSSELELRKQLDELQIKCGTKTEQLKIMKEELDKMRIIVLPLETEVMDMRNKESHLLEKLEVSKSHVQREKALSQKLKDQVILDNKNILDLNRQIREMERILKRKNPDSVSALIFAANSEHEAVHTGKVKLLESRIATLESDIQEKEETSQEKLIALQRKFNELKDKYEMQILDLEEKLVVATAKERKSVNDMFTQTVNSLESKNVENGKKSEKLQNGDKDPKSVNKIGLKANTLKEDAHLIATIRGLKLELANKDKNLTKITKENQELVKTNRRLQKDREKLLQDKRGAKNNNQKPESGQKLYDPMQYSENGETNTIRRLTNDNEVLKEDLEKMNKEFTSLKNKRLHDLNLLQEEHEREMAAVVKEYSMKVGDSELRNYREQLVVLKAERDHLENTVKLLNDKIKYLSTPGTEQLQSLQSKILMLQQRHESRELTLQSLVRNLLKNKNQCKDCLGQKVKTKQLCYFRQELDHILDMLQEFVNMQ